MVVSLTEEQIEELDEVDGKGDSAVIDGFTYYFHEKTENVIEGKYVSWEVIFERNDGKYFIQYNSKSGSPFSDYEWYMGDELTEVRQVEVKKMEWRVVK
ncbi:hypothetical protein D3C75_993200 [compost metagenome]